MFKASSCNKVVGENLQFALLVCLKCRRPAVTSLGLSIQFKTASFRKCMVLFMQRAMATFPAPLSRKWARMLSPSKVGRGIAGHIGAPWAVPGALA